MSEQGETGDLAASGRSNADTMDHLQDEAADTAANVDITITAEDNDGVDDASGPSSTAKPGSEHGSSSSGDEEKEFQYTDDLDIFPNASNEDLEALLVETEYVYSYSSRTILSSLGLVLCLPTMRTTSWSATGIVSLPLNVRSCACHMMLPPK